MKTLHLPLKAKWYEMIESLIKPEEVELIPDVKEDNFPKINWEQRRYELAKAAMVAMIGGEPISRREMAAERIVGIANNIIEELKRNEQ